MENMPRRLAEDRTRMHEAASVIPPNHDGQKLTESMTLEFWTDAEGREHVEITSMHPMTPLAAKGYLHDAIYSLVHLEEIATR
jgi:hypothetical protein